MKFKEYLEESKPGRAWNGRLEKIDELLKWMYSTDVLNKGEKAKKDVLFNQYYRYYNDGDMPKGLKTPEGARVSKWHGDDIAAAALEYKLEEFIKKVLTKYLGSVDRGLFSIDSQLSKIDTVISVVDREDIHSLVKYWVKDVKDSEIIDVVKELESKYDILDIESKEAANKHPWEKSYDNPAGHTMKSRSEDMKKAKIWTPSMDAKWKEIQRGMFDISEMLNNVKQSLEKMKKLKLFDKE